MSKDDFYLGVVGASAGGLEALTNLVKNLPEPTAPLVLIVAQHLSPKHKSRLVDLLEKHTPWKVVEAKHHMPLELGHVYITPPNNDISVANGKVVLSKPSSLIGPKPSVSHLFNSVAYDFKEKTLAIVLSGSGSDGASGIPLLKSNGGTVLVQEPKEAAYDGMPNAAMETGMVDSTFSIKDFASIFDKIVKGEFQPKRHLEDDLSEMGRVFALLADRTGVDFTDYKKNTIKRRLESRMMHLKLPNLTAYLKIIEGKPTEVEALFNHVLIGVTQFFRDPQAFESLKEILSNYLKKKEDKRIRIWIAGCATGEEPYSIAMLLDDILGDKMSSYEVQIFATDIDEIAIQKARKGVYMKEMVELLPEPYIKKYFTSHKNYYEVNKNIRAHVLFSRHDLTNNPPFLKLDLVVCRNLLIYFNTELQAKVLPIFHYALHPGGLLFLGHSETIGKMTNMFKSLDSKQKIFARKEGVSQRNMHFFSSRYTSPAIQVPKKKNNRTLTEIIKDSLHEHFHQPYVVIDDTHEVLYISGDMSPFLQFSQGPATSDLFKQLLEDIEIQVRATIVKAVKNGERQQSEWRRINRSGNFYLFRVLVQSLQSVSDTFYMVIFESFLMPESVMITHEDRKTSIDDVRISELETELAETKEHLQAYIEELETTNEEMQSLNEEMQSANEELQSSNEELETSNEELQSTNEEIQIAYQELREVNEAVEQKDNLLKKVIKNVEALLNNDLQAFILIDSDYRIVEYNETFETLVKTMNGASVRKNKSFIDILPDTISNLFLTEIKKVKNGEFVHAKIKLPETDRMKEIQLFLSINPVMMSDDEELISIGMLEVTEQVEAEKELKRLNMKLLQSNQELEEFAYVASHDLQEPVRMVGSFTELLMKKLDSQLDDQSKKYARFVTEGAHRIQIMIQELLQYSRVNTHEEKTEEVDMNELMKHVQHSLSDFIERKNAHILYDKLPSIVGVPTLLERLFLNLVDNALKYNKNPSPYVEVGFEENRKEYVFHVKDNGMGIDKQYFNQIFQIFKRVNQYAEIPGTGLGLAICKRIVAKHQGLIWLQSTKDSGTTFFISFPK